MMELWYDAHADCDLWIEPLPEPVTKSILDLRPGDVEIDESSRMVYRGYAQRRPGLPTVTVTYDALYSDADIEDSQWRIRGDWGVRTNITIHARVVYIIPEEEEVFG
jgi:hypothetical protein